jgi:hypothetical protein
MLLCGEQFQATFFSSKGENKKSQFEVNSSLPGCVLHVTGAIRLIISGFTKAHCYEMVRTAMCSNPDGKISRPKFG